MTCWFEQSGPVKGAAQTSAKPTMGLGEVLWSAKGPANLEFNTWPGKPEASPNTIDRLVFIQGKVRAAVVEGPIGLSMDANPMAADIPYRNDGLFLPSFVSSTVISWLPYTSGPETTGGLVNPWTSGCCAKCVESGTFELPKLAWMQIQLEELTVAMMLVAGLLLPLSALLNQ